MNYTRLVRHAYRLVCVFGLMIPLIAAMTSTDLQAADMKAATIEAIEGVADTSSDTKPDLVKLQHGDRIDLWNSVSTGATSKLLVRLDDSLWVSMGQFSSLMFSDHAADSPQGRSVDITEGIVRISSMGAIGANPRPYSVTTPLVVVQPESPADPVDFVVEVYDPATAVVTVGKGRVRIFRFGQDPRQGKLVSACHNAYVEGEDKEITVLPVSHNDLIALVGEATIPQTIAATLDECDLPPAPAALPAPPPAPPVWRPEVEVDYWDIVDEYPYQDIRIISPPPYRGNVTVFVPGMGEWVIPVAAIDGWTFDPEVVLVCVRRAVVERVILYDRYCWDDLVLRRLELNNLIYINRHSGRHRGLWKARQELADLNMRLNWAGRRIARLERRVADLDRDAHRRLPGEAQRLQVYNQVANSFNAPANVSFVRNFRTRLSTQETLQSRFASMSGQELSQFGRSVSRERDPRRRLALRTELLRVRDQVSDGRLAFTDRYKDVGTLANTLAKEKDIQARQKLEARMATELNRAVPPPQVELMDRSDISALKRQIANDPNAQRRGLLEQRFTQLEQSMDSRKRNQASMEKIEEVSAKVAGERNPEKRKELLGSLKDLWVPALGAVPLGVGLLERHRKQTEASRPTDVRRPPEAGSPKLEAPSSQADLLRRQQQERARQADEQLRLDEQRKKADAVRRRQEETKPQGVSKQDERTRQRQEELQRRKEQQERQAEEKRRLREDQKKQSDIRRQQQEERRRATEAPRLQREDQKRQTDEIRRQEQSQKREQDRARQAEQQRLQQEEQKRKREQAQQTENQRREAERQKQQADSLRKGQEQQRKQQEQLRVQDEQRKNQEKARQADAQRKQAEQQKLQQQEQTKKREQAQQAENQRREAERQKQQADSLRKQQDQQRKQQDQLRLQDEQRKNQERARQADAQRRQAEEQKRQAEQARKQQDQQLRRQDEQRKNQEGARQADAQRRQAEEQKRQADQLRKGQEQHRVEQDRARQADIQRRKAEESKAKADQARKQQEEEQRRR